jgi:hypoxanthine phosphoribosyltransferase
MQWPSSSRRQRTAVEAKHLQQVQVELQRMDLLVVDDINILRKTIEDASIEFMEAQ